MFLNGNKRKAIFFLVSRHITGSFKYHPVLKISKTFIFFFRTKNEYSKKYRQGFIFTTDTSKWILKTDPCPYVV